MRDENTLPLTQRHEDDEKEEPKSLYYLGFEGDKTEVKYFNGLVQLQKRLGISSRIEIHPLVRQNDSRHLSHPKHSIPLFVQAIEEYESEIMTVSSAADHIIEWLNKNGYIGGKNSVSLQKMQKEKLLRILNEGGYSPSDVVEDYAELANYLGNNAERFCSIIIREARIRELADSLQKQTRKFNRKYDVACFFMDRDELSVSRSDFDDAQRLCKQKQISLYVSNPRFELWLLLHFLSRGMMNLEEVLNPHSIYLESCLDHTLKKLGFKRGYSKSIYQTEAFLKRETILNAIKNEAEFCEECSALHDKIGCNIGTLMQKLLGSAENNVCNEKPKVE